MNKVKISTAVLLILLSLTAVYSQCGYVPLTVNNPSFEGTPQPHITPAGWDICLPGFTPDTQPGSWTITLPASNGNTYLGLVQDPSIPWQEGAGQTLSSPMVAGTDYQFTIDLATTNVNGYGITPGPVELQLWGGWSGGNGCSQVELLWHSGNITNLTWVTRSLQFTPTANYDHILFLVNALDLNYAPYIMLDNMTPIIPHSDVPYFTYQSTSPGLDFCAGVNVQYTDSSYSPAGNTILAWSWDFGDGSPLSNTRNPLHAYPNPGTYQVTLEITDNIPCTYTVTRDVVIYPYPVASFAAGNACFGSSNVLSNTSTVQGNPYTENDFLWSFGDGGTDAVNPYTSHLYSATGQYNVNLSVGANGCFDDTTITVTVFPNPVVDLGPDDSTCTGQPITLDAGGPFSTYLWSNGSNSQTINIDATGYYWVFVENTVSGLTCSNSDTIHLFVRTSPSADFTADITQGCEPVTVHFSDNTTAGGPDLGLYTYLWNFGDGTSSALKNPVHTYTHYGIYTVTLTVSTAMGCDDTEIKTDFIVVWKQPEAAFSTTPANGVISVSALSITFNNQSVEAENYLWDFGDGNTSSESSPSHHYEVSPDADNQVYTVFLTTTSGQGCIDTASAQIRIVNDLLVFPNVITPNNDGINDKFIIYHLDGYKSNKLVIYNRWGKKIFEKADYDNSWDCEGGADGTYYFVLTCEGYINDANINGTITVLRGK